VKVIAGTAIAIAVLSCTPISRADAAPVGLWTQCETGSGAGQCNLPRGIAADEVNGHIVVADQNNARIDELNALGQFVKAWGWGVDTAGGKFESCTEKSECRAGSTGAGIGQFEYGSPQGIAVDSAGCVYVVDRGIPSNQRVQKFCDGEFALMFGGNVNKTKVEAGGASEEEENLCPYDVGDECQGGTIGSGNGEFGNWPATGDYIETFTAGTKTTADDKVYVGDANRIQVFDTEGVYQEQFTVPGIVRGLYVDTTGGLYVIYNDQPNVRKLSPAGELLQTFELKEPGGALLKPTAVAVGANNHVYAFGPLTRSEGGSGSPRDPIFEFDPGGSIVDEFGEGEYTAASTGLAANLCPETEPPGNLYVTNPSSSNAFVRAYGTFPVGCFKARTGEADPIGELTATLKGAVNPTGLEVTECLFEYGTTTTYGQSAPCEDPEASEIGSGGEPVPVHADVSGLSKGTVYHFRLIAKVGGEKETGIDETFKTLGPPVVSAERASAVSYAEATLRAKVNPEGFQTDYSFQYMPRLAYEQAGESFEGAPGTALTPVGKDRSEHPASAAIADLIPGTAYAFRIVASNSSGTTEGAAHFFNTYRSPTPFPPCPNDAYRTGSSAQLPDCRAYEMVSPVDKNGGDIVRALAGTENPGAYVQASTDGNRIAYTALFAAFAGEPSGFVHNEYLAGRTERGQPGEGWSTEGIHPPVSGEASGPGEIFGFRRDFSAFSADLCSAWLADKQTPPFALDAQEGYANLYRRENCEPGKGIFETLVPDPPYEVPEGTEPVYVGERSVQGIAANGHSVFFVAEARLLDEAAEGASPQIYERSGGALRVVSVLPDGAGGDPEPGDGSGFPGPGGAAVGSGAINTLAGAVSEDGSRVYWTSGVGAQLGNGKLYLRIHPEQGIAAGECANAATACTRAVSSGTTAFFWGAAADGSKAIYSEEEDLYLYDLAKDKSTEIAEGVKGIAGFSEDLGRIYLVSREDQGAGPNKEGEEAVEGAPNLYLLEGGALTFIGTLAETDTGAFEAGSQSVAAYGLAAKISYQRATRVTPDGSHIAFNSRAPLTGFDNTDTADGRPVVEVYSYDAESGELSCASCDPTGARPSGAPELRLPYNTPPLPPEAETNVPAAAWIPTWEHPLHASNVLSEDGTRLFFNSSEALLPRDVNGAQDVYEWEAAGTGSCRGDGSDPFYFPQNDGCIYLISSGESPSESEFWEASPDGADVFFNTASSLVAADPGSVDLYDARAGGGFAVPAEAAECEGEACQSPPPAPASPTPASAAYNGPGNVEEGAGGRCKRPARAARRLARRAKRSARQAKRARRARQAKRARAMAHRARRLSRRAKAKGKRARRCRARARRAAR